MPNCKEVSRVKGDCDESVPTQRLVYTQPQQVSELSSGRHPESCIVQASTLWSGMEHPASGRHRVLRPHSGSKHLGQGHHVFSSIFVKSQWCPDPKAAWLKQTKPQPYFSQLPTISPSPGLKETAYGWPSTRKNCCTHSHSYTETGRLPPRQTLRETEGCMLHSQELSSMYNPRT